MREAVTPGARRVSRKRLLVSFAVIGLGARRRCSPACSAAPSGSAAASLLGLGMVVMIFGVALLAPVLVRPLARVIGAPLRALPGHAGPAGARERRAPAAAHRDHRLGADDRPRARRLHGDLRRRPARVDRQGDRRAVQPLGADRHPRRRLLARARAASPTSSRRRRASTSSRRCASTRRTSSGGGDAVPGVRRRPGDRDASCSSPSSRAGDLQTLARAARRPGVRLGLVGQGPRLQASATRSTVTTPAGKHVDYELAGTYDNKVGMLGQFLVTNATMTKDWNQPDDAFILVGGTGNPDDARAGGEQVAGRLPGRQGADARRVQGRARPTRSTSCSGSSTRCSRCR